VIVLADNDLIQKLARCDLLGSLPELLGVPVEEIFIAPAARYQLLPKAPEKALAKCGNQQTVERIRAFLAVAKDIPAIVDPTLLTKLAEVPRIDSGEQLLFAACVEVPGSVLVSGDKAALTALISHREQLPEVFDAMQGRVITFESALLLARKSLGFDAIKTKLLAYPGYEREGVLKLIVKPDMKESDFSECLISYSKSVRIFLARKDELPVELFEEN
jgi:hypothetical protein